MNIQQRIELILNHISKVFNKMPSDIRKYAKIANEITSKIKETLPSIIESLNSNEVDVILALIPGDWDSKLRDSAVDIIKGFGLVVDAINKSSDIPTEIQKDSINKSYNNLVASKLIGLQDGNTLAENRYDYFAQVSYSSTK